ncbi:MAG: hypothetical protein DMD28_04290 [Gemmatimonadetes bacterium]|nr:MAG: hypothetical protein DMD28_04290 [Gemmatimonadota bacterium]
MGALSGAHVIELRLFGGLDLRRSDGRELDSILTQPKRIALLAFLAAATPYRLHRRDTLLGLFWPELDQEHARAALRQALHGLRQGLGADVLTSRGDEEVGVDEQRLGCDVRAFQHAFEASDWGHALELYRGSLLEGFFLSDSPEFERWLEDERARSRNRACQAAWTVAQRGKADGDFVVAAHWARRAAALVPGDEETLRRLVALLDDLGDRVGAVQVYEEFARRVAVDWQVEPAAETKALIALVRSRESASQPALRPAPASFTAPQTAAQPPSAVSTEPAARRFTLPGKRWVVGTTGLALLAAVMAIRHQQANARLSRASVGIVSFENRSGDTLDAYLGAALTEDLTRSLSAAHLLRVFRVPQARLGLDYILTGSVRHAQDTLDVTAQLERTGSGEIVWATRLALRSHGAITVPQTLTSGVLRALGAPAGAPTERPALPPDPAAYDLFLRGRYEASRRTAPSLGRAVALLSESIRRDSTFAPAWAGLAAVLHNATRWGSPVRGVSRESLLTREISASDRALQLDSTGVDAWLTRASASEDVDPTSRGPALRAIHRALALDSLNAEAWDQLAMAFEETGSRDSAGAAWHRAIALDPGFVRAKAFLAIHYWWWRAYDSAAAWADSAVATDPLYGLGRVIAGQAALSRGRRDEAESQLGAARRLPTGPGSNGLSGFVSLAAAAGDTFGARRLVAEAEARTDFAAPDNHSAVNIAAAYAVLGGVDRALAWLERYRPARDLHFQLHLRLDPPLDPLRREPRFQALLLKGPLFRAPPEAPLKNAAATR